MHLYDIAVASQGQYAQHSSLAPLLLPKLYDLLPFLHFTEDLPYLLPEFSNLILNLMHLVAIEMPF
jgi:hypothetical protein